MVVGDVYVESIAIDKAKAHTPLVIDADAPLAASVAVQRLQSVGRGKPQLIDLQGVFELIQAQHRTALDVQRQPSRLACAKQAFGFFVGKAANHATNSKQLVY